MKVEIEYSHLKLDLECYVCGADLVTLESDNKVMVKPCHNCMGESYEEGFKRGEKAR